jgi:carbonic anhydrase
MKKGIFLPIAASVFLFSCKNNGDSNKIDSNDTTKAKQAVKWDYEHPDWQNEGFNDCGGKVESPINVETAKTIKAHLPDVTYNYSPFNFKIVDNGHTIQVLNAGNNTLTLDGNTFEFKQFHFHHKGEHAINGVKGEMEMHLVHADSAGNLLVVAMIIKEGAANPTIGKVLQHIPEEKEKETESNTSINLSDVLPADKKYYTYTGSLTTPPCTDGIEWIILKQPITMSAEQIASFTKRYANDARPLQKLNNRYVLEDLD